MLMDNQNKYQNGRIYKIVDVGYNKCYIGSTIQLLAVRKSKHIYDSKKPSRAKPIHKYIKQSLFKISKIQQIEIVDNIKIHIKEIIQKLTCYK